MRFRAAKLSLRLLPIAAILALAAYPPTASARQGAKKRAHLIVTSVKAAPSEQKPAHRFWHQGSLELVVTIKNKGEAPIKGGGGYGSGEEGVLLSKASGALGFSLETDFLLPKIGPGEHAEVPVGADGQRSGQPEQINTAIPKACVPVNGKADFGGNGNLTGRTDCGTGPQFATIPRVWDGTMSATLPVYGYAKLESDATPTFKYHAGVSEKRDEFVYSGAGDLIHSVSGSNGTCTISGGKNSTIGPGEANLVLKPNLLEYGGGITTADVFTATQTCNGASTPIPFRTLGISIPSRTRSDETETKLQGTYPAGSATFRWDLDAR